MGPRHPAKTLSRQMRLAGCIDCVVGVSKRWLWGSFTNGSVAVGNSAAKRQSGRLRTDAWSKNEGVVCKLLAVHEASVLVLKQYNVSYTMLKINRASRNITHLVMW
jgi:hypothetical protein